ncbi:hypothetical protein [Megamonas hypermegale]|uniref:ATPase n=1 Tax=Megamonas hypermegale TaxID=158847 RepID=A0A921HN68_9FIRM|nr:hypothetical protein [Megamonas hypermegale]MDM8142264.1 hypothetical protein [Megamonas hypermegale]HJF85283.1 hypothetical protein [Megamonas hypermegale]
MDIIKTLDELEELVSNSSRLVFTNKCLIEEDALVRLIDDIRKDWPSALKEAEEITQNRDKIIEDARAEAKNIIEQAKAYAQKKASEDEITLAAKARAKEILEKTFTQSEAMRNDSVQYAQQVFDHMGLYVQNVMNNIQAAKEGLKNIEVKKEEQPSSEEK